MRFDEVKRHLNGREERFQCDLVLRRPHVVVLRYVSARGRRAGGFRIPAGSRTLAFYWPRRPYVLYSIAGPDGAQIANRFDVVEDVRIGDLAVSFRDLLLDLWAGPDGAATVEDDDEVADATRRRDLSARQVARIASTRALLLRRHTVIVREAMRLVSDS